MNTELSKMKLGELAALYILAMRSIYKDFTPVEIQDAMESKAGDLLTLEAIRNVRIAINEQ